MLLEIMVISKDLSEIIKSITLNWRHLLKFSLFGLVMLYIYGIVADYYFASDFDSDTPASSFILVVTSTIK